MNGISKYKNLYEKHAPKPDEEEVRQDGKILPIIKFEDITEIRSDINGVDSFVVITSDYAPAAQNKATQEAEVAKSVAKKEPVRTQKQYGHYALVLRRIIVEGQRKSTELEIQSPTLQTEFQNIAADRTDEFRVRDDCVTISSPYQVLFHVRERVKSYVDDPTKTDHQKKEMDLINVFIETDPAVKRVVNDYNRLVLGMNKITQPMLWTIFKKGDLVLYDLNGVKEYWRFTKLDPKGTNAWTVSGTTMGYNGYGFGEVQKEYDVSMDGSEIEIGKLPIAPAKFVRGEDEIRKEAIMRGKKWYTYKKAKYLYYDGTMHSGLSGNRNGTFKGRVMVDYDSYIHESGGSGSSLLAYKSGKLTDEDYLLFPSRIPGFVFQQKTWNFLDMKDLRDIEFNSETYSRLEMDPTRKDLVRSLVMGHYNEEESDMFDDIVEKKGRGLIFLLSGPPGLGKTLLAESISEHTKRPLYSVSCGEVSDDPVRMEQKLQKIFQLGRIWSSIILLDEADVLMSRRQSGPGSVDRNAISTVFLRILEYYEGILFLTTNRVDDFDEAILDRIHVTLTFRCLEKHVRERIWRMFIEANPQLAVRKGLWIDEVYAAFADFETNGRTIKNLLRTASAYAKSEKKPLEPRHVQAVIKLNLVEREGVKKHGKSWGKLVTLLAGSLEV